MPNQASRSRLTTALTGAMVAVVAVLAGLLLWHTTGDLDLLLHDRVGSDTLAGQGFGRTNQFSFTAPDHAWINHEWLFQVVIATVGNLAGSDAFDDRITSWSWLRLGLGLALVAALAGEAIARWRRSGAVAAMVAGLTGVVGLAFLGLAWIRFTLRPELLSALLLVLVLGRIETALRTAPVGKRAAMWIDPRHPAGQVTWLSLFWYQCHGFAFLVPALWLLAAGLDRGAATWRDRMPMAAIGATLTLLLGAITPAGLPGLLYPVTVFAQFGGDRPDLQRTISELVPLLQTRGSLAATLMIFQASIVWGVVWTLLYWPRISWLRVAIWLVALAAAWKGQRNLGLYAVAFVLLHTGPLVTRRAPGRWLLERVPSRAWTPAGVGLGLATLVVAGWWAAGIVDDRFYLGEGVARRFGLGSTPANYPLTVAGELAAEKPRRIANTVDAASTLIHRGTGPVLIDGRTEAYPPEVWRMYASFREGGPSTRQQLVRTEADAICVVHRNPASHGIIRAVIDDPRWELVSADPAGIAFMRRDEAVAGDPSARFQATTRRLERQLGAATPGDMRVVDEAVAWAALLQMYEQTPPARDLLERVVAVRGDHPVALHNLGNVLMAAGDLENARRRFEAAARGNRNSAPPLVNAGTCLFRLGRVDEAAASFTAAIARDPDYFEAWANLAEARRQLGDREGAGTAYRRALELRPGDRRLRNRARTLGLSS